MIVHRVIDSSNIYEDRHRGATWVNQIRDAYCQESMNVENVGKSKSWLNVPFA